MHPLAADALCVERCAKPPAPQPRQMPVAPDRVCHRCHRESAHPLVLGKCREHCADPAGRCEDDDLA
jgi:hypothetical protein